MPKQITKLTNAQKASMRPWAEKWIKIGLQTGDADWETFDKFMPICYQKAGLSYPSRIIRVSSPLVGGLAAAIAEKMWQKYRQEKVAVGDTVGDTVRDTVRGAVGDTVRDTVRGAVADAVGVAVGGAVEDAVRGAVGVAVEDAVGVAVEDAVEDAVGVAVGGAVEDAVEDAVGGAMRGAVGVAVEDAQLSWHYWLGGQFWVGGWWYGSPSYVSFFTDICNLKLEKDISERAEAYRKVCESVNYIWCNKDFVMVCDRPKHIHRDEKGRLHSITEKAIEYKDGWGLYMINGIRFEEEEWRKFTSGKMDAIDIMREKNQDKKRVMIMNYGNEKLIKELKAVELSRECDGVGNDMVLWKIPRKDDAAMIFYEGVDNSKNEKIYLRLPPEFETKSPLEAKLWTFAPLWNEYQKTGQVPEFIKET